MDLVYYLKDPGEEFRYSLRSVAQNLPVTSVTIVGDVPSWVKGVKSLGGNPTADAHVNSVANIHIASRAIPGEFVVMNDDFFVLSPRTDIPHYWYHTLTAHSGEYKDPRSEHWRQLYLHTAQYLTYKRVIPKSFELHVPIKVVGKEMNKILNESAKSPYLVGPGLWRSIYGNLSETVAQEGITRRSDVKVHTVNAFNQQSDFVSTDEKTNAKIMPLLRDMFPDKCKWERR